MATDLLNEYFIARGQFINDGIQIDQKKDLDIPFLNRRRF